MTIASPKVNKFLALFLAVILLLACCFSVPSHAVAIVDDAAAFSLVALLSSWGFSFAAIDGDKGQVTEAINDLLGAADVVLDYATSLVTPAGAGLLKISPSLYNAGLKVGQYLINQVGSDSGSHAVVAPSSSLVFVPAGTRFPSSYPFASGDAPVDCYGVAIYTNPQSTPQSDGRFWYTASYWNVLYSIAPGRPSAWNRDYSSYTVNGVSYYAYVVNTTSIGTYDSSEFNAFLASSVYRDDYSTNGSEAVSLIGSAIVSGLIGSSGFGLDANLSDAVVPSQEVTVPMYVQTPTASYTTNESMTDFWYGFMSDQAIPYPTSTTVPWDDVQTDVMTGIGSNVQTMSQTLTGIRDFMSMLVEDTVGFVTSLPSYLGQLSGKFLSIWYYVVNWVQSLRPWFNTMFTIWNGLPAAMVVPVWASAVIVIVIGMYRRFFM